MARPIFRLTRPLIAVVFLLASSAGAAIRLNVADPGFVDIPEMPRPAYLEASRDPAFGTPIFRVTDPGREMFPEIYCGADHCRHRYASSQAWNADQTLLVIQKGCPGMCFLDGQTYKPLFQRDSPGACEWHPSDSAMMICVSDTEIIEWNVRAGTQQSIYHPKEYTQLEFGPGKGNLSRDGNRLVIRAIDRSGTLVAFAYDMDEQRKYPDVVLGRLFGENSYCSISPTGSYIFCFQSKEGSNPAYVFGIDGELVQHWAEDHRPGHGDMTIDANGDDVYVGISKSEPDKYRVIKRRLSDGKVTVLSPRGPAQHVSARNIYQPGWVIVTFGGTAERASRDAALPLYQEIDALRIDGSGELRRIAHTRSVKSGYESEAQASPSPDGSQIIWASNWGDAGGSVASYVARLRRPGTETARSPQRTFGVTYGEDSGG